MLLRENPTETVRPVGKSGRVPEKVVSSNLAGGSLGAVLA